MKLILENWQNFVSEERQRAIQENWLQSIREEIEPEDQKLVDILNKLDPNNPKAKRIYRQLAKKYHPDKKGGDGEDFKKVNNANTNSDEKDSKSPAPETEKILTTAAIQTFAQEPENREAAAKQLAAKIAKDSPEQQKKIVSLTLNKIKKWDKVSKKLAQAAQKKAQENNLPPDKIPDITKQLAGQLPVNKGEEEIIKTIAQDAIKTATGDNGGAGDKPPEEGGETNNPEIVDPEPDDLAELKKTYLEFRDKFYCPIDKDANMRQRKEAKQRCAKEGIAISKNDQHDKIKALMVALEDIIEKEEREAGYDRSKQPITEQSSRPIVALKADLTMFLRQARGAQNIINKASETAGSKAGKYHLKKAIERAKDVLELTGNLYDDLRRVSKGLQARAQQTPPKSDLNEAAQEVEKAYDLVLSNIEDIIGDIGDDMPQAEFLPRMNKSLEGLESILKYFPKGRLGGKGSAQPDQIYKKYTEALSQFGDNFSILKNLPDELSDRDTGSTSLNVAAQQIRAFANDLVEIFGLQMPASFNNKVEKGPAVEVPGAPEPEEPTEEPAEDPEQVIQDLAVELETAAEAAIKKANEELPDGTPEQIAKRAEEILAANKAAEEELRKQAETDAAAKEALEQAEQEELKKQEELAVQNAMKGDETEGMRLKAKNRFESEAFIQSLPEDQRESFYYLLGKMFSGGLLKENFDFSSMFKNDKEIASKLSDALNNIPEQHKNNVANTLKQPDKASEFVEFLKQAGIAGKGKSIPFSTERDIIKFFNFTLFKDPTIKGKLENLNMDDKDFSNFKKVMAFLLSSKAKFLNESLKDMSLVSGAISDNSSKVIKVMFSKDKPLYKWFKSWIRDDTAKKKLLFLSIGKHLKKKNYNLNLDGLTIQRLQGLSLSAAPTDIPPKEEDAIKKTVEKVKNNLKDKYPDQDELVSKVEKSVVDIIQNPKNSEMFDWSADQPSAELSSMVGDFVLTPTETDAEGTPEVSYPNINYELGENAKQVFNELEVSYGKRNKKDPNIDFDNDLTAFMNFIGSIKSITSEAKRMFKPKDLKNFKTSANLGSIDSDLSAKFYENYQNLGDAEKRPIERIMKAITGKPSAMKSMYDLIGAKRKPKEKVQESLERILKTLIKQQLRGK